MKLRTIYVKKLVSLNPRRYEFISIVRAMESYQNYVNNFSHSVAHKWSEPKELKDFQEYLTTEI